MEGVKNIKEIADTLGTNRQKVWRIVRSLDIKECFAKQNKMYFADEDVMRIRQEFIRLSEMSADRPADKGENKTEKEAAGGADLEAMRAIMDAKEAAAKAMLEAKDEQIKMLKEQLQKTREDLEDLRELLHKEQESVQALMIATAKPRLVDRIRAQFAKHTN